ncbi:QacE family quaternary ammonium compound efflux SMR transporter [Gordonia jinghuaiqii]|uniref:QacE family quaternary ammonium compound efflux SMR transporter n=1 Tax=Gordonia jinghuaiqii TaxID=2758710 RepID=A0A7D7R0X6_9ACTN|nr:SMR family transporter [Gordonia jinghuaiqii]MCR5976643.1 QacE family quaternary ammonium compound efflux SMR transporter [Gordonia jinghuaiqii]QMT03889.1 QacE family quaternary ammonium compound efflux SMR transporter [Gordonia jinghuaiqii]
MAYAFIVLAIIAEVTATLALRVATDGRPRAYAVVAVGYVTAFVSLTVGLRHGVPLGVAYGIWAAAGVAATAVAAHFLFGEQLNRRMVAGIGVIVVGVLLVELGAIH